MKRAKEVQLPYTRLADQPKKKLIKDKQPIYQTDVIDDNFKVPMLEYTTICNADLLPVICNDFISDYMTKNNRFHYLDRNDSIDLTRNFCWWLVQHNLTCAHIEMSSQ